MIQFNYETDFIFKEEQILKDWIMNVVQENGFEVGEINYVFCDDEYLHKLNVEFLQHDTLTDIITFDYSANRSLSGDLFISIDRVRDNAETFKASFDVELRRVMVHGLLHLAGYGDKSPEDEQLMRRKEDEKLKMFHVEQ